MFLKKRVYEKARVLLKQYQQEKEAYDWDKHARPSQRLPEGAWRVWLILAGRGFGKTRTGAESIRAWVKAGKAQHIALVGHTLQDVEKVMVQGKSGLLSCYPGHQAPRYYPSQQKVQWPCGAVATLFSACAYEKLRGPQFDGAWVDELAKFDHGEETWDQLMFSLRLGAHPQVIVTTTPRPTSMIRRLLTQEPGVHVTRGTTFENKDHLSKSFLTYMKEKYHHSNLGQQELYGAFLEKSEGALWSWTVLAQCRLKNPPDMARLIISVDPAVSHHEGSDETGIIVAGKDYQGHGYILQDASGVMAPKVWAEKVVSLFHTFKADGVVVESNQGGDLVTQMIKSYDAFIPVKKVHALRSKKTRAEPVAALYEQGRIHHVGFLKELEHQMCTHTFTELKKSPDRLDACVWALTELFLNQSHAKKAFWMA